jgi:hypothetical protein
MASDGEVSPNGIFPYEPNQGICIAAAILFGLSAAYHLFQTIRTKTWFYTPLIVGSISKNIKVTKRWKQEIIG